MFKETNPPQNLFGVDTQLSEGLRRRLRESWAHLFKTKILPVLFRSEEQFSCLYGDTGRFEEHRMSVRYQDTQDNEMIRLQLATV